MDEERRPAEAVASFGGNFQFRPEKAPPRPGHGCFSLPHRSRLPLFGRKHDIDHPDRWALYAWDSLEHLAKPTIEDKFGPSRTSPYGRCVWKSDKDVVDHQSVLIDFEDGCTASHNMIGGAAKPSRTIHLIGTCGEPGLPGRQQLQHPAPRPRPGCETAEEVIDLNLQGDMGAREGGHVGGDMRLVADFIKLLDGEPRSIRPRCWKIRSAGI